MSNPNSQFLKKVVKFVSNPTTQWSELAQNASSSGLDAPNKAEIKAMIERRQRNDFVRKRELDMLRKIRRKRNNPDMAGQNTLPSAIDSMLAKPPSTGGDISDAAVKAKIDEIELQMVGYHDQLRHEHAQTTITGSEPTQPDALRQTLLSDNLPAAVVTGDATESTEQGSSSVAMPRPAFAQSDKRPTPDDHQASQRAMARLGSGTAEPSIFINEQRHDDALDEAVFAFANAEFDQCEKSLSALIKPGCAKENDIDTWLLLFDLYRALSLPLKFENLTSVFVHHFGISAPAWYSLPDHLSLHMADVAAKTSKPGAKLQLTETHPNAVAFELGEGALPQTMEGWVAPWQIDLNAVANLQVDLLQMPKPWVIDWTSVDTITPEAAMRLHDLLQTWSADSSLKMTWVSAQKLSALLAEISPTGVADVDPAFWMLRLQWLRFINRPDQFDETAIDYCITYEQSPPSWEPCHCVVRLLTDPTALHSVQLSHIGDVSTNFVESQMMDERSVVQVATLDLSGQLTGDISQTLAHLDGKMGNASSLVLDCSHLIRIDFSAAGDLLNWVTRHRINNLWIELHHPHRLLVLFFEAMGISEHVHIRLKPD
jgi:ABC-type transporter Mla MlaB component